MAKGKRIVADCRQFPSESDCSLTIAGTEGEVLPVAVWHAVSHHKHKDTPQLRKDIKALFKPE